MLYEVARERADGNRPVEKAAWRPFEMSAVRFGHVLGDGRMATLTIRARMEGDALVIEKALDRSGRDADIELSFHQRVRDAVVMAVKLDMIVDVDAGFLPFGVFVGLEWKRFKSRLFKRLKLRMARAGQLFERLAIERVEKGPDTQVEVGQGE